MHLNKQLIMHERCQKDTPLQTAPKNIIKQTANTQLKNICGGTLNREVTRSSADRSLRLRSFIIKTREPKERRIPTIIQSLTASTLKERLHLRLMREIRIIKLLRTSARSCCSVTEHRLRQRADTHAVGDAKIQNLTLLTH